MPTARARSATLAEDPISDFFAGLAEPGRLDTFAGESAMLRFDVRGTENAADVERWLVTIQNGAVTVTRRNSPADAVVRIDRQHFQDVVTGRLNAQAALLRGLLTCEGSVAALMMFQRCLPGPPGSAGGVAPITSETVMAQRRPA